MAAGRSPLDVELLRDPAGTLQRPQQLAELGISNTDERRSNLGSPVPVFREAGPVREKEAMTS